MLRLTLLFFVLTVFSAQAQPPDAWINYTQQYYKIPVAKDARYRLSYSDLQQAGFPVNGTDPKYIQIFHRGVEQAVYLQGEEDSQFNVTDYLEFYGRKNDGTLDAALYKPASLQPHSYYNLFSDTTSYFLTIGSSAGKRMVLSNETNTNGLTTETFHYDQKLMVLSNQYAAGEGFNGEVFTSSFDRGEGWTGVQVVQNGTVNYTFTEISLPQTGVTLPQLELLLVGRNNAEHKIEIYVGPAYRLLTSKTFYGFNTEKITQAITWEDISVDGKLQVRMRVVNSIPDRVSVSYIKLTYAQKTDASLSTDKVFTLQENVLNKSYVEIKNAAAGSQLYDITNPYEVIRIGTTSTSTLNAVVSGTATTRKILISNTTLTPKVSKVNFRQITPSAHNYIIISHPLLRKPAMGYDDPVKGYGAYRASAEGGGYDTLIVNTQLLYDQFNYGESSPLAIFKFLEFLSAQKPPDYLFLIGKALDVNYNYHRSNQASSVYKDLVPTSGYPGSDMFFSAGLNNTSHEPAIPTGRLTATKPEQVAAYLNKIKEMEALPFDALWRKKILHLSGGIEEGEPEAFKAYLEDFGSIAEGPYLGAQVSAIAKNSRDLQLINIAKEVNEGVNLVTFFGHSSPSTLDFDIGFVTNPVMGYNNTGKYPMLLMNGCEAGAFFLKGFLFGEDWVMADKKGASGFIAHTSYALVNTLRLYTSSFYNVAYADSVYLKRGIGDIQKETARRYMELASPQVTHLAQIQQMVLLGDPAVKLFGAGKPDLEVNKNNISITSFNNEPVTALSDSFAIKFIVRNFGMSTAEPFRAEVVRTLSDNTTIIYDSIFQTPAYSDTLTLIIRKGKEEGFGNNRFALTLDADHIINELNEENNSDYIDFVISLNGTRNLFPHHYAIVNSREVKLSFQSTDISLGSREFMLEIDTVHTFSSGYKQEYRITADILAQKSIALLEADTLAYYWRTRLAQPLPGESESWDVSSFTYINNGEEGWAQVHFPQFLNDPSEGLVKDEGLRRIRFKETVTSVDITNFGASAGKPRDSVSVKIAGAEFNLFTQGFGCRNNTINLIAFDRRSAVPYAGIYFKWYEILYTYGGRRLICGREPFVINSFTSAEVSTGNNNDLIHYIDNVAEGDSVVVFSIGKSSIELWALAAKVKVGEIGISQAQLNALVPGAPVVILGKKGSAPGSALVFTPGVNPTQAKQVINKTVTGGFTTGTVQSTTIGPAQQWNSLIWKVKEQEANDVVKFDVVGITLHGETSTLIEDAVGNQDLSGINAEAFPYLHIVFHTSDELLLTTTQLHQWMVLYTPAPEGILLPKENALQVVKQEGETWIGNYNFINISNKHFADSLQVKTDIFNQLTRTNKASHFKIKQPAPGDTTQFSLALNTLNFSGLNDVNVNVNPRALPEQYYDNNIVQRNSYLRVVDDVTPPVVDVSIDGRYVENGDFVSPTPLIVVKVKDENKFLLKTDTVGMRLFLTYPCEASDCQPVYVNLASEQIKWFPATIHDDFKIEYRPESLPEGRYVLRVEAADARGNTSGAEPYEISFIVEHETALQFITPYPNPFNDYVSYGFVVSGKVVPSVYKFMVTDITGKTVKVIQHTENQAIFIGHNYFTWNGNDQNGNTLPNGLYLYRSEIKIGDRIIRKQGKIIFSR